MKRKTRRNHQPYRRERFLSQFEQLERRDLLTVIPATLASEGVVLEGNTYVVTLELSAYFGNKWGFSHSPTGTAVEGYDYTVSLDPDPSLSSGVFSAGTKSVKISINTINNEPGYDSESLIETVVLYFTGGEVGGSGDTFASNTIEVLILEDPFNTPVSSTTKLGDKGCDCPCNCSSQPTKSDTADGSIQAETTPPKTSVTDMRTYGPQHSSDELLPVIASVDTRFAQGQVPVSLEVNVAFNGDTTDTVYYDTDGVDDGEYFRLAQTLDATGLAAGRYPWTMEITENYASDPSFTYEVEGFALVNGPSNTPISPGWSIPGIDRLVVDTDGATWTSGGDLYWFEDDGGDFTRPDGEGSFSTLVANIDTTYSITNQWGDVTIFDATGLLTEKTDRYGNTITYTYTDGDGDSDTDDISEIELQDGRILTYSYDDDHLVGITDFDGREITLGYADGQLASITYPDPDDAGPLDPFVVSYSYLTGTSLLASMTVGDGETNEQVTSFTYNEVDNTIESRTNQDSTVEYFVDALTLPLPLSGFGTIGDPASLVKVEDVLASVEDEGGNITYYELNSLGLPVRKIDPEGNETIYERDADGRVTLQIDPDPNVEDEEAAPETAYLFEDGNLTLMTLPDSSTRSWHYNTTWNIPDIYTDEFGLVTKYDINGSGLIEGIRLIVGEDDELSSEEDDIVTTFDDFTGTPSDPSDPPAGLPQTVIDPLGNVTVYVYNARGNPLSITYADGTDDEGTVEFHYNALGLVDYQYDELDRRTDFTYDLLGRLTLITLADPDDSGPISRPEIEYAYDTWNRVIRVTDPLERETGYTYDKRDRQLTESRPDHDGDSKLTITKTAYDPRGFVSKITDPLGHETSFSFNKLGQLTYTYLPEVADPTTAVNEVQIIDFDSGTEGTFKLNGNSKSGTVNLATLSNLQTVLDSLWGKGNTSVTHTSTEATVTFKGNLSATNISQMTVSDISGTKGATPTVSTDKNGVAADLVTPTIITVFDPLGRTISSKDALDFETTYDWSNYGNTVKITLPDPDAGGKLESPVHERDFDISLNRQIDTDANEGETTSQYNSLGQLVSVTGADPDGGGDLPAPVTSYQYDLGGNLRFVTDPLGNKTEFQYDHRNRQVKVISADPDGNGALSSLVTEYEFDKASQLISVTAPGDRTTIYEYDGLGRTTSITDSDPDGKGGVSAPVTRFAYDSAGQMIGMTDPLGNETVYGYDLLGNPILDIQTDPDGAGPLDAPLVYREFDAAGQLLTESQGLAIKEVQRLYFGSKASPATAYSGTYYLTFDGQSTSTILASDGASTVQSYLEGLSNIGYGNILVTDTPGGFLFIFRGDFSNEDVPGISATPSLVSTDGISVSTSVTQSATAGTNEVQTISIGGATTGTFDLGNNYGSVTVYSLDSYGIQSALNSIWGYGNASVYQNGSNFDITLSGSYAAQDVSEMSVSNNYTDGYPSVSTTTQGAAGLPEIVQFSLNGSPTQGEWQVIYNGTPNSTAVGYNASAYDVQNAMNYMYPTYSVSVSGSGPWTATASASNYTWGGQLASGSPLAKSIGIETYEIQAGVWDWWNTTTYEYDNLGQLVEVTSADPDGGGSAAASVTHYAYDLNGNLVKVRDPLQFETTYDYDPLDRRSVSRDALGGETAFTYDPNGNLLSLTDPEDNTTTWQYDYLNRTTKETNELGKHRYFSYDAASNLIQKRDRLDRYTVYEYDDLHRQVAEEWWADDEYPSAAVETTAEASATSEVQYVGVYSMWDIMGSVTLTYDGQTTGYLSWNTSAGDLEDALEGLSNLEPGDISVSIWASNSTNQTWIITFTGDLAGTNVPQITINSSSVYHVDIAYIFIPVSEVEYTDVQGDGDNETQVVTLDGASGGTFTLDFEDQRTAAIAWNASAGTVEAALETLSNIDAVSVSGSAGGPYTITFEGSLAFHDVDDLTVNSQELTNADFVRRIAYTFNDDGDLEEVSDPDATYEYTYDDLGRVMNYVQNIAGLNPEIEFVSQYNAASRRTQLQAKLDGTNDFKNTYAYDNMQRLTQLIQMSPTSGNVVAPKQVMFAYNEISQYTSAKRYASTDQSEFVAASYYSYDDMNRLTKLVHSESTTAPTSGWGSEPLAGYEIDYDAGSRITAIDSYLDGLSEYEHDDTYQLLAADHATMTDEDYEYDANGNRIMSGYNTTANNQLQSDGTYTYTYDDEGNRLTRTRISDGYVTRYEWDFRNRLISVTEEDDDDNALQVTIFVYDAFNQWMGRSFDDDGDGANPFVDTFFVYESGQVVMEFDGDDDSDLSFRYFWGPDTDQFIAQESVTSLASAGSVIWGFADQINTIRDLVTYNSGTDDAAVANHREFDSYGNLTDQSSVIYVSTIGYTGRMWDITTGLQNNLNRWYDPKVGRWISEDPIGTYGNDLNLQRFVSNSPLEYIDPDGLERRDILFYSKSDLKSKGVHDKAIAYYERSGYVFADTTGKLIEAFDGDPCKNDEIAGEYQTVTFDRVTTELWVYTVKGKTWYGVPITPKVGVDGSRTVEVGAVFFDNIKEAFAAEERAKKLLIAGASAAGVAGAGPSMSRFAPAGPTRPNTFRKLTAPRRFASPDSFEITQRLSGPDDEALVADIQGTIKKFKGYGPMEPIVVRVDSKTGKKYILDGHHRVEAAKREGCQVAWREATELELKEFSGRTQP